jgi:hypothetical protein
LPSATVAVDRNIDSEASIKEARRRDIQRRALADIGIEFLARIASI